MPLTICKALLVLSLLMQVAL